MTFLAASVLIPFLVSQPDSEQGAARLVQQPAVSSNNRATASPRVLCPCLGQASLSQQTSELEVLYSLEDGQLK
jgi:hypothetical protein